MEKYKGIVDKIKFPIVKGWAFNEYSPKDEIEVNIIINEIKSDSVKTNLYREGTKLHEAHPTGVCGFEYILPKEKMRHGQNIIEVQIRGNSNKLTNSKQILFFNRKREINQVKIFYMHIAKTAGTTVNKIISDQFPEEKCITHIETLPWTENQLFESYDYVSGHVPIQLFEKYQSLDNIIVTTILRNPIDQIASHFKWLKYVGLNPTGEFFKSHPPAIQEVCRKIRSVDFSNATSLNNYIKSFDKSEHILLDNLQVRYFIRDPFKQKINSDDLNNALSIIPKFTVLGKNNQLEKFFSKINQYGLQLVYNFDTKLNVNNNNFGLNPSDPKIQEILYPLYKYDLILYNNLPHNGS